MIEIYLDPAMFTIGPIAITWHGFFSAVGLFVGVWVCAKLAETAGIKADDIYAAAPFAVLGGIIGARLFHVVDRWDYYASRPLNIFLITEGGIAIYGGIIGGVIAGYLYALRAKIPAGRFADAAAIGLILGQAVGRIGDIINGEHRGKPLSAPWAVVYTHPNTLGDPGVPVHLAVGYEMLLDLAVFALLIWLWKRVPAGVIFWLYLVLYSAIRLWIGFYRIDTPWYFGLGQAQIIGVIGILVGIPLLIWTLRRQRSEEPATGHSEALDAEDNVIGAPRSS